MNIVVLGADRGLGKILSEMLVSLGHKVAAGYVRLPKDVSESENMLRLQMDVTKEDQLQMAVHTIEKSMQQVDAVVDVAGVLLASDRSESLMTESIADIRKHMDVNAIGLVAAFRALYPIMKKGSRFFAVTSEGGSFTLAGTLFPAYSVSKTAANKFVQVLRLTITDVDLIAVHPGRMNTEMGKTTAQIEPEESAAGFCNLIEGVTPVNSKEHWFIDYLGRPMPV